MKYKKYLIYVGIPVVAAAIGLALFFTLGQRPQKEQLDTVVSTPVIEEAEKEEPEPAPEPEEEKIENLYISSSDVFGSYSFICPQGWTLTEHDDGFRVLAKGEDQAVMVMVEAVADLEDMQPDQIAQKYMGIAPELDPVETLEQDFDWGQEPSMLYGYRFESGLNPDQDQVDLLSWQEREGYLYMVKYMANGLSLDQAVDNFADFASTFRWEAQQEATVEKSSSNAINILILGDDSFHDRAGGRVSARTDINILLHINLDHWDATIVTIPRDLWVPIPGYRDNKFLAAHALGGPQLTVETFELFSGVEIDSYIITDMCGFIELIDFLGGVTVEVEEDLADGFSGCYLDQGVHHLDGEQALALSRNRQRPGGAFAREEESAKMIVALYDQKTTLEKILILPAFINQLLNYTWTDMDLGTVMRILPALGRIDTEDIEIIGVPSWPQMVGNASAVVHDPEATEELFWDLQNR